MLWLHQLLSPAGPQGSLCNPSTDLHHDSIERASSLLHCHALSSSTSKDLALQLCAQDKWAGDAHADGLAGCACRPCWWHMADDPHPPGPPYKRVKTARDYEREARRPDKRTRQWRKDHPDEEWTQHSDAETYRNLEARGPRVPPPLTLYGGPREPRVPPPPPRPPSRPGPDVEYESRPWRASVSHKG